jgi:putative endonuclease
MYSVYIIYSKSLGKFYTGFTSIDINERIRRHKSNHSGYTGKANDWKIIWIETTNSKSYAQKLEKRIKARGAKRYIESQSK